MDEVLLPHTPRVPLVIDKGPHKISAAAVPGPEPSLF